MNTPAKRQSTKAKISAATTLTVVGGSLVVHSTPVQALSPVVDTLDDNVIAGDGQTTLREALYDIAYANNGSNSGVSHTITFAPGLSGTIDLNYSLFVPNANITIDGPGADVLTLRNPSGSILYLYGTNGNKIVSGLTLQDAGAHAVSVSEAGFVSLDEIVIANSGGPGIVSQNGGSVYVSNSTITGSASAGIDINGTSSGALPVALNLSNVTIDGNSQAIVANEFTAITIDDSTISGHSGGPAIEAVGENAFREISINRSTISGNTGSGTSAIDVYKGVVDLTNTTVTGNGGDDAIVIRTGDITVRHSTLSGNIGTGAVIELQGSATDVVVDHSIITDNAGMDTIDVGSSGVQQANWSLLGTDVTTEFNASASGNNVETDTPGLGALGDNGGPTPTMIPATDSPAIDSGDPAIIGQPATDQTGIARVIGGVDIGAVEVEQNGLEVTTLDGRANDAQTSLSEAIAVANSNPDSSDVTFASGLVGTTTLDNAATITTDANIVGPASSDVSVSAPGNAAFVLDGAGVDVDISGLTITNATTGIDARSALGGTLDLSDVVVVNSTSVGVDIDGLANATVTDSNISQNASIGIAVDGAPLTITETTVHANGGSSAFGGGIRIDGAGDATIVDSVITDNVGASGAGIRMETGDLTVSGTTVAGNTALASVGLPFDSTRGIGGGIGVFAGSGTITIDNSTISGNTASISGGGISVAGADVELTSSTVTGNDATSGASGLDVADGSLDAAHSTISANTTSGSAVGVQVTDGDAGLDHTILADNDTDDFVASGSGSQTAAFSLIENTSLADFSGATNIGTNDASLASLADNGGPTHTMLPASASPAIDAGDPTITGQPATDQRGEVRIIDTIDIGSVESPIVLAPGLIDIDPASLSVNEEAGTATFTVTRSGGNLGAASVEIDTAFGTATAADFTPLSSTASWADGEDGAKTVQVALTADTISEDDETFSVALSGFTGAAAGSIISSAATIIDNDDVGVIDIDPATISVGEDGASVTLTVTRSGGTDGAASVDVDTNDASAAAGSDFAAIDTTLTWADGEDGDKTVEVTITDDGDVESDETFDVDLSAITGALAGSATSSEITIVDNDDVGVIDIDPATITVSEDGTSVTLDVTRSGGTDGAASADVDTANQAAIAPGDYTAVSTTLNWADGQDGTKSVVIPIIDDTDTEGDEAFTVDLSAITGATAGTVTSSMVTIASSDQLTGEINIGPATISVGESATTASVTVTRTGGNSGAASIKVDTVAGIADASDFTPLSTTLTWSDGDDDAQTVEVAITSDSDPEADEDFMISLSSPTGASLGNATSTTVTIIDDDDTGIITLTPATTSASEDGSTVALIATRALGSDGPASATVTATNITATAGADFDLSTASISWADGELGPKAVLISLTDDSAVEGDETFSVALTEITGSTAGNNTSSVVTIVDDETPGEINIFNDTVNIDEDAGTASITLTRTGGSDGAASALVATSVGSAGAADFAAVSTTVSWADGDDTDKTVDIAITDDDEVESGESFSITLSNVATATIGSNASATVTIIDDDDVGVIDLAPATTTVEEDVPGGTITLNATRSGGSDGVASATITATNDTATAADYTLATTTVAWADGETGTKTITINITDDSLVENTETFSIALTAITGSTAGNNTSSVVTISDDETPGEINISNDTVNIDEDAGTATITLTRTGGSDGSAAASLTLTNGTATEGADFDAPGTAAFWVDGASGDRTITIDITDDALVEGDETFTATLSGVTGAVAGSNNSSTITITDDETPGEINISNDTVSVNEDAGTATITLTRTGGSDGAASAMLTTADASATEGSDFDDPTATASWADGDAANKTITIDITDDALVELDEMFAVNLSNVTGAATGSTSTATVTIVDNDDVGVIDLSPATLTVNEDDGSITLTATRSGGSDGAASATVTATNNTATSGDYAVATSSVSWADGESGAKTITINITDDALVESTEDFSIELTSITGSAAGTNTSSTTTISDDEVPGEINISTSTISVDEDAGTATITLSRTDGSDGPASATLTAADGSATQGDDYSDTFATVTWADGDSADKTISVTILDDSDIETDEDFTVSLSAVSGASAGSANSSTVTIVDNDDVGTISISPATISVSEDGSSVLLTVTRSGGSDGAASVTIASAHGTTTNADYTTVSTTRSWADGETGAKSVLIFITDDSLVEDSETFNATLSGFVGATAGTNTSSVVTILDDEGPGDINLAQATLSVDEDAGSALLTLTRSGGNDGAASVRVTTAPGTATIDDFTAVDTTVTWASDDSDDKTVLIPIVDDSSEESNESFTVTLSEATVATLGADTSATVTIVDNDEAGEISITPITASANEDGAPIALTLRRTGGSDGIATATVTSTTGSASSSDFTPVSRTVTWADGDSDDKTVSVFVTDDGLDEANETFTVSISATTGADLGSTATSTITIVDDDGSGEINLSPTAITVDEDAGTVAISVVRSGGNSGQAFGVVTTTDGSAVGGSDFTTTALLVSWANGEDGAKIVNVPILDDGDDETNETFTVDFVNPSGAPIGDNGSATITIVDNDEPVAPEPTSFVNSVAPARIVDTRQVGETVDDKFDKVGAIEAGDTLRVDVAGRAGVPDDAKAAVINVTSVRGDGVGFLTVHPCLDEQPGASSLNFDGSNTPNEIIAGLSASGELCVFASAQTDLLVDVVGYIAADSAYQPLAPARLLETRPGKSTVDGIAAGDGSLDGGETFELKVRGRAGVSDDATAVVVNVTSIKAPANGFVTVHPCLDTRPGASSVNYTAGSNRANEIIAEVSDAGTICLYASSETGLLVDVVGQLTPDAGYSPVAPARLVDSRAGGATIDGDQAKIGTRVAGSKLNVDVEGRAGVPDTASAVVVNLTAVRPAGGGFFTTFDCGVVPNASSLNYSGANVANELIVELNDDGNFCLFTSQDADVLIDVVGYL